MADYKLLQSVDVCLHLAELTTPPGCGRLYLHLPLAGRNATIVVGTRAP
jgi:hypothetical protein